MLLNSSFNWHSVCADWFKVDGGIWLKHILQNGYEIVKFYPTVVKIWFRKWSVKLFLCSARAWFSHNEMLLTYKALYGLRPGYLKGNPAHAGRSADEAFLCVPPISDARLMGTKWRPFLVVAPLLWNSLPCDACLALSLTFRCLVKIELFRWAFNWACCSRWCFSVKWF